MLRLSEFWFLALCLPTAICRPVGEPTKFSLNGLAQSAERFVNPEEDIGATKFERGMEMLGNIADKIRFGRGRLVNSIMLATNIIKERGEDWLGQISDATRFGRGRVVDSAILADNSLSNEAEDAVASETQNTVQSVVPPKIDRTPQEKTLQSYLKDPISSSRTRETARLENEAAQGILERPKQNPFGGFLENFLRPTPIVDGIREEQKYGNNGDKFIGIGRALVNGFEGLSNFLNVVVDLPLKAAKNTSRGITEALNQVGARLIGLQ